MHYDLAAQSLREAQLPFLKFFDFRLISGAMIYRRLKQDVYARPSYHSCLD